MCQRPKRAFSISTRLKIKNQLFLLGVNALNGLSPFLLSGDAKVYGNAEVCQRPKRAFSISTMEPQKHFMFRGMCQRPKRAFSISTKCENENIPLDPNMCQRPKRAFSISTKSIGGRYYVYFICVNALNGLSPFLQCNIPLVARVGIGVNALNGLSPFLRYPLKPRINTGFPALFLQVFI